MVLSGLLLASAGLLGALAMQAGVATVVLGSMFTAGGGLAFLGLVKWRRRGRAASHALHRGPHDLLAERSRRVRAALEVGPATFEIVMTRLKWTETVVLETLVVMKEDGAIVEDLDLESGHWVYRLASPEIGATSSPTLADRMARARQREETRA